MWTDAIEPGVRAAGYEPIRIDKKDHNNRIDEEIEAAIRRARFSWQTSPDNVLAFTTKPVWRKASSSRSFGSAVRTTSATCTSTRVSIIF